VATPYEPFAATTPDLASPIEAGPSPLWPQHLVDVFLKPTRFFSSQLGLGKTPYVVFVTWCYGIASAVDRIDQELLRAELGRPKPGWEAWGPLVVESWAGYWALVLAMGAISGLFLWWLGGWWYRLRLKWAGDPDPDKKLARLVYVYSSFVWSGPAITAALGETLAFSNYLEAWNSEQPYTLALLIFPLWSVVTSYLGAKTIFNVSPWGVRIWFLVLPMGLYLLAFGLIAAVVAVFTA
jgi:hypothetical protein